MLLQQIHAEMGSIDCAIIGLEKQGNRSRFVGLFYLASVLIIALSVVVYFGSRAVTERAIKLHATQAMIEPGIHIDEKNVVADLVGSGTLHLGSVLSAAFLIQFLAMFPIYSFRATALLFSQALALHSAEKHPNRLVLYATNFFRAHLFRKKHRNTRMKAH